MAALTAASYLCPCPCVDGSGGGGDGGELCPGSGLVLALSKTGSSCAVPGQTPWARPLGDAVVSARRRSVLLDWDPQLAGRVKEVCRHKKRSRNRIVEILPKPIMLDHQKCSQHINDTTSGRGPFIKNKLVLLQPTDGRSICGEWTLICDQSGITIATKFTDTGSPWVHKLEVGCWLWSLWHFSLVKHTTCYIWKEVGCVD